jgi:hypothetical protein
LDDNEPDSVPLAEEVDSVVPPVEFEIEPQVDEIRV